MLIIIEMIRHISEAPINDLCFIVTLHCSILDTPFKIWASTDDTIGSIKEYMGERFELFADEMTLIINQTYPYPLSNDTRLGRLLIEHRHLILTVHEGGELHYGVNRGLDGQDCTFTNYIPMRYIDQIDSRVILDFRYISVECISRIRPWMYLVRTASEIWLLGTHPKIMDILYAIAEDILCLVGLHRIVIQNSANPSYFIPYKSAHRQKEVNSVSQLQREGLCYLFQHLLLDQYRPSAEEVEIWIDDGLLPNVHTLTRFLP